MRRVGGRLYSMMTGKLSLKRCQRKQNYMLIDVNSHFGHDKSIEIRGYQQLPDSERPVMFYAGDGVSDLSAAKETDLLFAKKHHGKYSLYLTRSIASDEYRSRHLLRKARRPIYRI